MFSENAYENIAKRLGCEVAALKAIAQVESGGKCFTKQGRLMCLFEGHVFYKETKGKYAASHPTLCYPSFCKDFYKKNYDAEYTKRFSVAFRLDAIAAMKSTSWGAFQIMGFNHAYLGFKEVGAMVDFLKASEDNHLELLARFIEARGQIHAALINKNWRAFAHGYNGSQYEKNQYDKKMAAAYKKFNK